MCISYISFNKNAIKIIYFLCCFIKFIFFMFTHRSPPCRSMEHDLKQINVPSNPEIEKLQQQVIAIVVVSPSVQ